jgi:hypothetical protein
MSYSANVAAWPVYLEQELRSIPQVLSAFVAVDGPTSIRLLIFVSDYNDEIIEKVLDVEDRFMDAYKGREERFTFDVLANPQHISAADLVPGVTQIYYRSASAA